MSDTPRHPITSKPVQYTVDGMERVVVRRDIPYAWAPAGPLVLDFYESLRPSDAAPVVVLVTGYPDVGVRRPLGCAFKEMAMWTSLGRILAASGMAAVGYTSVRPGDDIDAVLGYLREHASALRVDVDRIGLWATSGHVPAALGALARHGSTAITAAVLSTGYTLDLAGSAVTDAGRRYGFSVPAVVFDDLPSDVPVFIGRAGRDENPGLNEALDRFIAAGLAKNWPMTVMNHPTAGHAFELSDDATARCIVRQMVAFARFWLGAH